MPSLIVLNARGASLQGQKLTLVGVAPNSIVFADRPVRSAGHVLTAHLLEEWGTGSDSFAKDPPNATVSVFSKDGSTIRDAVVVLKTPNLAGDQLTFDVQVLEGDWRAPTDPLPFSSTSSACPGRRCRLPAPRAVARLGRPGMARQPRHTIIRTTPPRPHIIAPPAGITPTRLAISLASYRQLGHNDWQNCCETQAGRGYRSTLIEIRNTARDCPPRGHE